MEYDVVVVGGGPSGATAAEDLARSGHTVAMIDRDGMVDRETFDPFLRTRAWEAGAHSYTGTFTKIDRTADSTYVVFRDKISGNRKL